MFPQQARPIEINFGPQSVDLNSANYVANAEWRQALKARAEYLKKYSNPEAEQ